MPKLEGFGRVITALGKRAEAWRANQRVRAVTSYNAPYAIFVHEDTEAFHPTGQAKFLEQPGREHRSDIARVVREEVEGGATMGQACLTGAEYLLELSRPLVPFETGYLASSGDAVLERR